MLRVYVFKVKSLAKINATAAVHVHTCLDHTSWATDRGNPKGPCSFYYLSQRG